jgi:hypothetical protein
MEQKNITTDVALKKHCSKAVIGGTLTVSLGGIISNDTTFDCVRNYLLFVVMLCFRFSL